MGLSDVRATELSGGDAPLETASAAHTPPPREGCLRMQTWLGRFSSWNATEPEAPSFRIPAKLDSTATQHTRTDTA